MSVVLQVMVVQGTSGVDKGYKYDLYVVPTLVHTSTKEPGQIIFSSGCSINIDLGVPLKDASTCQFTCSEAAARSWGTHWQTSSSYSDTNWGTSYHDGSGCGHERNQADHLQVLGAGSAARDMW